MSHLRRRTNTKKDFYTTRTESDKAYNRIITDSATNEETKYLIDIIEEEISEAEQAKSKTSENLATLETKIEGMTEDDVGNNEDLKNQALEVV